MKEKTAMMRAIERKSPAGHTGRSSTLNTHANIALTYKKEKYGE